MQAASSSLAAPSSSVPATPAATVPGGLAAGRWEAPEWAFWFVAGLALAGGLAWAAVVAFRALRGRGGLGR